MKITVGKKEGKENRVRVGIEGTNLQKLFTTIDKGVDVSNFGDPSSWQQETRKDKAFNFNK